MIKSRLRNITIQPLSTYQWWVRSALGIHIHPGLTSRERCIKSLA